MEKHAPDTADPADAATWRRARDTAVAGDKARELFGPDVIWPRAQVLPDAAIRNALDLPQQGRVYCRQEEFEKNLRGAKTMNRGHLLLLCLATITFLPSGVWMSTAFVEPTSRNVM